jgi:iron(III) transport system substrate-binding protein
MWRLTLEKGDCSMRHVAIFVCVCFLTAWEAGCKPGVVVYTAQDEEFATPIFEKFTEKTGIAVEPKFDSESTKTVGLFAELVAEAPRPRADVFWNNEPLNTMRLEKLGLLEVYRSPAAEAYPAIFRSPNGTWAGFAARARVLIVNTNLVSEAERPKGIEDLADPKWKGRVGMAKPLFGATATQAACLFAFWGPDRAKAYYRKLKENQIQVLPGNKQVAVDVSAGKIAFGICDTDDAIEEVEHGRPVVIVYPDQQAGGMGTMFFPNTLSVVKGCPHPEAARKLVDYLLSPAVESALAAGPSAQIPLNPNVEDKVRLGTPRTIRAMKIDFAAAADEWDAASQFLRDEFTAE